MSWIQDINDYEIGRITGSELVAKLVFCSVQNSSDAEGIFEVLRGHPDIYVRTEIFHDVWDAYGKHTEPVDCNAKLARCRHMIGSRIRVSGGYSHGLVPSWLNGHPYYEAPIRGFLCITLGRQPVAVARLAEQIHGFVEDREVKGNHLVLELRYISEWEDHGVAQVYLARDFPFGGWNEQKQEFLIESHASYEILNAEK